MLSDSLIREYVENGTIGYTPFDPALVQPASIDMRLDRWFRFPGKHQLIDTTEVLPDHTRLVECDDVVLWPGDCVLATTAETVKIPPWLTARVEGKSSLGRLFLAVHITAGFIDPGFEGQITLEIVNMSPWSIKLHAGMRIAQIAFFVLSAEAAVPYAAKGHYHGQVGPTESRYKLDRNAK